MPIKPLVCYVSFNNMIHTVSSLLSLLKCDSDFDLIICDNYSKDYSWKFIESINDPRIIEKKRFEKNCGCVNAVNYALTKRVPEQDFCLVENDATLLTYDKPFEKMKAVLDDCGLAGIHASTPVITRDYPNPKGYLDDHGHKTSENVIIGMFYRISNEIMNKIGFYDETTYAADQEFNHRIRNKLGLRTGYTLEVQVRAETSSRTLTCESCKNFQQVCKLTNTDCLLKVALNRLYWTYFMKNVMSRHQSGTINNPIVYRGTHYRGELNAQQMKEREECCNFFIDNYKQMLQSTGYANKFV